MGKRFIVMMLSLRPRHQPTCRSILLQAVGALKSSFVSVLTVMASHALSCFTRVIAAQRRGKGHRRCRLIEEGCDDRQQFLWVVVQHEVTRIRNDRKLRFGYEPEHC